MSTAVQTTPQRGPELDGTDLEADFEDPDSVHLARDIGALEQGEMAESGIDYLMDENALSYVSEEIEGNVTSRHRTSWFASETGDSPIGQDQWIEMWRWQHGWKSSDPPVKERGATDDFGRRELTDKVRFAHCVADTFGCTDQQIREIRSLISRLNLNKLGAHGNLLTASLAVIHHVTREDRKYGELSFKTDREDKEKNVLKPQPIVETSTFDQICNNHEDLTEDYVETAREIVENEVS